MKQYYIEQEEEKLAFALESAKHFKENKDHTSYTRKDIEKGCWFAQRWGADRDCVVVFKIDECEEVVNYCNIIK